MIVSLDTSIKVAFVGMVCFGILFTIFINLG